MNEGPRGLPNVQPCVDLPATVIPQSHARNREPCMDATCNGFTSQKCPCKLCAARCRSVGYCSVHKKPNQPVGPSAATAHPHSSFVTYRIEASRSQTPLVQDSSSSDDDVLATGIQMSLQNILPVTSIQTLTSAPPPPHCDTLSGPGPVHVHAPVHTHQMSCIWSQKEIELNEEELARKKWERKKVQAHLESKQNLDV